MPWVVTFAIDQDPDKVVSIPFTKEDDAEHLAQLLRQHNSLLQLQNDAGQPDALVKPTYWSLYEPSGQKVEEGGYATPC